MFDAAVIGGGPAGSIAAIDLARRGHRVVLIDKASFPRHLVCGEFLSPESRDVLDRVGVLAELDRSGALEVSGVRLTAAGGADVRSELDRPGLAVSRYVLDQALLERAVRQGVDVRTGCEVRDIAGSLVHGFVIETESETLTSRMVIGAYGKRSRLDRNLDRPFFSRTTPYVGLKQHYSMTTTSGSVVELHAFNGGYCGLVGIEGGRMNACSLIRSDVLRSLGSKDPFAAMALLNTYLAERLKNADPCFERALAISQISFVEKDVMHRDICMTGDAAGLITPLCGDGMAMAMNGGELAAHFSSSFLTGTIDAADFRVEYRRAWAREFIVRTRIGRALQRAFLAGRLGNAGLRALSQAPPILRWMIRTTRG
jgi:menaquinone-9 beta-reductase